MKGNQFRSIQVDDGLTGEVHFCNPFPDRYAKVSSRSELTKIWKEESQLREAELRQLNSINKQH